MSDEDGLMGRTIGRKHGHKCPECGIQWWCGSVMGSAMCYRSGYRERLLCGKTHCYQKPGARELRSKAEREAKERQGSLFDC